LALSPQLPRHSLQQAEKCKLAFDILYDADNAYARELGLAFELPAKLREVYANFKIDLPGFNGSERWELPIPGRFVIAQDGTVRYAEADPDYTTRPEPDETLRALRSLSG
jgi:peroxiredoxin